MNVSSAYTDEEYYELLALRLAGDFEKLNLKTAELREKYYPSKNGN